MGISVGTNGVSVYEHAGSYLPSLLVWQGTITNWTHIAIVYKNKQPILYINGDSVRTGKPSTKIVHPSYEFSGGYYGTMNGQVDEVRIWNVARTKTQIRELMSKRLTESAPSPMS